MAHGVECEMEEVEVAWSGVESRSEGDDVEVTGDVDMVSESIDVVSA